MIIIILMNTRLTFTQELLQVEVVSGSKKVFGEQNENTIKKALHSNYCRMTLTDKQLLQL